MSHKDFGIETARARIEQMIEHMLTRPLMYCPDACGYESAMLTVLCCWSATHIDFPDVRKVWQEVIYEEADHRGISLGASVFFASLAAELSVSTSREVHLVAGWMRVVWRRLSCAVERLGQLAK